MSWFGGESKKEESVERGFADDSASFQGQGQGGQQSGGGLSEFQEFSTAIQQQMVVQQAITDLSDRSFYKCITTTKEATLSGREVACIHAVTNKWLDTNELMIGRLAKKQQQASQSQYN
jgi:hypothetical protein